MARERKPRQSTPIDRPSALYAIHDSKTAAGLDALLYSVPADMDGLTEFLSLNRVILGNGGFCVLAARVQFQPGHGLENLMDANGLFSELLETELERKAVYYMAPLRGLVICLVAMPYYRQNSRQLPRTNELLRRSGAQAVTAFRQRTGLDVLAAVSPTCFGLDSVPGTFHRNLDLLQFHLYFGQKSGICESPADIPRRPIRISSEFQEQCAQAINLLLAEQREEFFRCVTRHLENIRPLVPCSLQQYQILAYQYLDMLCYTLMDHHLADTSVLERTDLFWLVHRAASFVDLVQQTETFLTQLSPPQMGNQRRSSALAADKMKAYFQLHHRDTSLTVSSAAAEFQMSQPVFSACFLKYIGVSPLEYLNKLRVQSALELLRATSDTLPEIAQASGFGSVSTLHRVFKRVTGMTPAQARNGGEKLETQ